VKQLPEGDLFYRVSHAIQSIPLGWWVVLAAIVVIVYLVASLRMAKLEDQAGVGKMEGMER
jgi:hypothetical protein